MNQVRIRKLIYAGVCLALAYVLPFFTGNIPKFGSALSPMHIPALLCGFLCGPVYGAAVGFAAPLLRSLLLHMPPLFPQAAAMAFELAAYGLFAGIFYRRFRKSTGTLYLALIVSMLLGRVVWGVVMAALSLSPEVSFSFEIFLASGFVNALPGILLHLVLIPPIVLAMRRAGLSPDDRA